MRSQLLGRLFSAVASVFTSSTTPTVHNWPTPPPAPFPPTRRDLGNRLRAPGTGNWPSLQPRNPRWPLSQKSNNRPGPTIYD